MKNKILHLEKNRYPLEALIDLQKRHTVTFAEFKSQHDFDKYLKKNQFHAIFTKLGLHLGKSQILQQKELRYIITPTTGYNHIDIEYAQKRNIKIIGLKGEVDFLREIKSTAEHTWALLLSISKNLHNSINSIKIKGIWDRESFLNNELDGKTIGIIGYGRLGKIVSEYANAFGMNIIANDIDDKAFKNVPSYVKKTELFRLLELSDYIVLLISWNKRNIKFLDTDKFKKFKKGAFFINTSRGEFVDEIALLESLKKGKLKGAALDVLNNDSSWDKSTKIKNLLIEYSKNNHNLIITPHVGGYGKFSVERTRAFITKLFLKEGL